MYGGLGEEGLLGDEQLYSFRELDWVEITPPKCEAHPGPRAHHALAWLGDCVALLGGVCELRRGYASSTRAEVCDDELYLLHLASGEWLSPDLGAGGAAPARRARARAHALGVGRGATSSSLAGARPTASGAARPRCCATRGSSTSRRSRPRAGAPAMRWLALDDARARAPRVRAAAARARTRPSRSATGSWCLAARTRRTRGPIVPPGEARGARLRGRGRARRGGRRRRRRPGVGAAADRARVARARRGRRRRTRSAARARRAPLEQERRPLQRAARARRGGDADAVVGLKLDWHGDWTMIPGCRESHFSCADAERGALYIFGGESANGMVHNRWPRASTVSDALGIEPLADDAEEEEEEEEEEVEADRER